MLMAFIGANVVNGQDMSLAIWCPKFRYLGFFLFKNDLFCLIETIGYFEPCGGLGYPLLWILLVSCFDFFSFPF